MVTKFLNIDTDNTLSANSNERVPSQKAVKTYTDNLTTSKQNKVLDTPIIVGSTEETTVEGALGAINTSLLNKQNQSLSSAITVDGTQQTTVEGTLNALNIYADSKQNTLVSGTNIKTVNGNSLLGSGNVDINGLPSQTGQSGKYLTTNGTNASWDIPMVGLPLFYATYQPHKLNNASWLRADPYSWHRADVYVSAYAHLANNISGVTAETETVAGTTITFYPLSDEIKVVLPDQQTNLDTIYNATGIGYYFVLDTTNRRFKLPRNIYGFTGYRGDVGGYVPESLPNITGRTNIIPAQTTSTGATYGSGVFKNTKTSTTKSCNSGGTNQPTVEVDFDASSSSSTYQNNAPVQQRATQAYLYFYVGNTVQNQTEIDVGEITEALNGKLDISAIKRYPIETYDDGNGNGYVVYSDGWCEQWGSGSSPNNAFTFLKEWRDVHYRIVAMPYQRYDLVLVIATKRTTDCVINYSSSGGGVFEWIATGYLAEE